MNKDKTLQTRNLMRDILDGGDSMQTTKKSLQNMNWANNRPEHTSIQKARKGRRLTGREMSKIRRLEQIWPDDIQYDADSMRGFKVS